MSKEKRISDGFVRWFLTRNRFTLDDGDLVETARTAVAKYKELLAEVGITAPGND